MRSAPPPLPNPTPLALSPRLRLAALWPALAALFVLTGFVLVMIPGIVRDEAEADLLATARLVAPALGVPPTGPYDMLQERVSAFVAGGPYRLSVIAADGTVLADSGRSAAAVGQLENHGGRPEVVAALRDGEGTALRHSATTDIDTLYAARLVAGGDGRRWVVRLAKPLAALASMRRHLIGSFALGTLAALGVVVVLSFWLSRSLFSPFSRLVRAAAELGEGKFDTSIPQTTEPELAALGRALGQIAAEAKARLAAVGAERDHLRRVVESLLDGVLVTDARGRAAIANRAFREIFAVRSQSLEVARLPAVAELLETTLASGAPSSRQVELYDGPRRVVELSTVSLGVGDGAVVVARDRTAAEQLQQTRRDLVANASHELKTPLAAIRALAETLAEPTLADAATRERLLGRVLGQCARGERLVADLLTLARLESKAVEPQALDLADLVRRAIDSLAEAAADHDVAITLTAPEELGVIGDPEGLSRAVRNLIDNAVRYHRRGGRVEVSVRAEHGSAVVEVRDDGPGISAEALPRLFERFYRVDRGRGREDGGTGLGLAIVKHVAQAHDGRIEVESHLGAGTTFRLSLPLPTA